MTSFNDNVKKYFTERILDLSQIALLIVSLFMIAPFFFSINDYYGYGSAVVIFVLFYIMSKGTEKFLSKWEVGILSNDDEKKMLYVDTFYGVFLTLIILVAAYFFVRSSISIVIIVLMFLLGFREIKKWRKFKTDNTIFNNKPKAETVEEKDDDYVVIDKEEKIEVIEGDVEDNPEPKTIDPNQK